jgi:hypothetical protein
MGHPPNALARVARSQKSRSSGFEVLHGRKIQVYEREIGVRDFASRQCLQAFEELGVIQFQKFPAPTFVRFDACNFQNEESKLFYLTAGVLSKNLQAGDILG